MKTTRGLTLDYVNDRQRAGALNKATATGYRNVLACFADVVKTDPSKLTRSDTLRWLDTFRGRSQATKTQYQKITRGFCAWLQKRKTLTRDVWAGIDRPKRARTAHRPFDRLQVAAMLAAADARERTILLTALHTGLRRAELAALEVGDVAVASRMLTVVRGKGGHSRIIPLSDEAAATLAGWIATEGLAAGPLFRSRVNPSRGLSPNRVGVLIREVADRAGVKVRAWDGVGAHTLRRTMATDVYRASGDVLAVQRLLGHENLSTTQLYVVGLDLDGLRGAVEGRSYLTAA